MGVDGGEEDSLSGWQCSCGGFRANAALSPTCGIGGGAGILHSSIGILES